MATATKLATPPPTKGGPLLQVKDLKVYFTIKGGTVFAVDGVSFTLERGQTMGLVGESGCGKTTTAYAITRLLPPNGSICGGEILFGGVPIGHADLPTELREILKSKEWKAGVLEAIARTERRLLELRRRGSTPTEEIESKLLAEEEGRFVEKAKTILARTPNEEELHKALSLAVLRELSGFFAARRRRKIEADIEDRMRRIRWSKASMIFQSAMNAFNPVYRVGEQIVEALQAHSDMTKAQARTRTLELFDLVGLDRSRITGYPHEFSGGMKQRAMIAMALACNPELIIADEPTTALDVIMQDRILAEIRDLQKKLRIAMIIITHDISVVAEVAERIAVMYAGELAEHGDIQKIFKRPAHPYTIGLMNAFPSIRGQKRRLAAIPGSPTDLSDPPPGCRFHPRCKFAQDICRVEKPVLIEVEPDHLAACHFAKEVFRGELS